MIPPRRRNFSLKGRLGGPFILIMSKALTLRNVNYRVSHRTLGRGTAVKAQGSVVYVRWDRKPAAKYLSAIHIKDLRTL